MKGSVHDHRDCERCQLDLAMWGQAIVDSRTGEHLDVQHLIYYMGNPEPVIAEAIGQAIRKRLAT